VNGWAGTGIQQQQSFPESIKRVDDNHKHNDEVSIVYAPTSGEFSLGFLLGPHLDRISR
jgi:hypothetical protein